MPKCRTKVLCPICSNEYSASVFKRHVYDYAKHQELIDEVENRKKVFINNLNTNCVTCGKEMKIDSRRLINAILFEIVGIKVKTRCDKKFCSNKCFPAIWNKGLTKNTSESMKRIADGRIGKNNPIHKVLNDPEKKKKWLDNVEKSGAWEKNALRCRGKTLVELYGEEKAKEIKEINSQWCKTGKPHKGHNHTEETKNLLRRKTAEHIANNRCKTSKPELLLFSLLQQHFPEEEIVSQFLFGFYTIDITFPEWKIAVEVDGDFWHSNKEEGFSLKFPCQKRNAVNDKNKNVFLLKNGWSYLRIWVSEIERDIEKVIEKVKEHLCEKKTLLK